MERELLYKLKNLSRGAYIQVFRWKSLLPRRKGLIQTFIQVILPTIILKARLFSMGRASSSWIGGAAVSASADYDSYIFDYRSKSWSLGE